MQREIQIQMDALQAQQATTPAEADADGKPKKKTS
jgi:hypothetical protein